MFRIKEESQVSGKNLIRLRLTVRCIQYCVLKKEKSDFRMEKKLSLGRKWCKSQCFHVGLCMEFEENDGKVERNFFTFYFANGFQKKLSCCGT